MHPFGRVRSRSGMLCMALLALWAGCAAPLPPVPVERAEWSPGGNIHGQQLKTEHFDLRCTVSDETLLQYLPTFLEACLEQYRALLPPPVELREPFKVYLFASRGEWEVFTRVFAPQRARIYLRIREGAYMDHTTATTVAYDLGRDRTLSVLGHECMHQYLVRTFPEPVVPWLNEGLSCQWEAFDWKAGRPVFTPERNILRKNSLRSALYGEGGWIPLSKLLTMHAGDAVYQTGQTTSSYYAQVWAMILFLRSDEGATYAEGFQRLLADAGTKRVQLSASAWRATTPEAVNLSPGELIFCSYITANLATFDADYRAFARLLVD